MADIDTENLDPFVGFIRTKFQQAETSRIYDEKRWLTAYRNYRGIYGPEMAFRTNENSKAVSYTHLTLPTNREV